MHIRAAMAPRLQAPDASAFLKRTRSADTSTRSTPTKETATNLDDADLPIFLRQTDDDVLTKFEHLNENQLERLRSQGQGRGDPAAPWAQCVSNENRLRNRYMDIRPWDKFRVKLKVPEGVSDYINASPILLRCSHTGDSRRYIATQGPKESSVEHFWQMVWHETDTHAVVIMLTQLEEGFREKCYRYFPSSKDANPMEFKFTNENGDEMPATLKVTEEKWYDKCKTTARTLELKCQEEQKVVHHLFFQAWPDYGVPLAADRIALLELIKLSRDRNLGWNNPRIVHCSAGVGRTGTFIAIEHLLAELGIGRMDTLSSADDPVFETVEQLRQQRMTMVQSLAQFQFIYDMILEAARARAKEALISDGMKVMSTGLKSPGIGEPAPKAMRFSRAVREAWTNMRERSNSRKRTTDSSASSPAPTPTRRPESASSTDAGRMSLLNGKKLGGSAMSSESVLATDPGATNAEMVAEPDMIAEKPKEKTTASGGTIDSQRPSSAEESLAPSHDYPTWSSSKDGDSEEGVFPSQEPSTQDVPLDESMEEEEPALLDLPTSEAHKKRESWF